MPLSQPLLLVLAVLLLGSASFITYRKLRPQWKLVSIKGDFTVEHHLPDILPVPRAEVERVSAQDFNYEEAVAWMREFVRRHRRHKLRGSLILALRKVEFYKELSQKMGRGLWREVDEVAGRLAQIDPLDPSAALARGRAMRQLGKFSTAIRHYQEALRLQPFHSLALPEMAATCRMMGQPGRARTALDQARRELGETHPLTIESRVQLGELVRVYADPRDPATIAHVPREQYLETVQSRLDDMDLDAGAALRLGQQLLSDDMPELAENLLHRSRGGFADQAELLLLEGLIEHYHLRTAQAETLLRRSIKTEPTPLGRLQLGRVLLERARHTDSAERARTLRGEAQQELRLAIDRDPNQLDAISLLVEDGWAGGLEAILLRLRPLINAYPDSWAALKVLGDAYTADDHTEGAIDAYEKAIGIECNDEVLMPYLTLLDSEQQHEKLLAVARKIPNLQKRDPALRWKIAQILCEKALHQEARGILQSIVDDEEAHPVMRQRANELLDELDEMEKKQK